MQEVFKCCKFEHFCTRDNNFIFFYFQARFTTQYDHSKGSLGMKMTDDVVCIQFKTDAAQDVRRLEKFVNNLMRHMASKEHN